MKKNKKRNAIHNDLILLIIFGTIFLLSIAGYFVINYFNNKEINYDKVDESKDYIYTYQKYSNPYQEEVYDEIPYINVKFRNVSKINNSILETYNMVSKKNEYDYSYKYNLSDNILSLVVTYAYYPDVENVKYPIRYFDTYNIDLGSGILLSDAAILERYHLNNELVNDFLGSKFRTFYGQLIDLEYFTERQCNYSCFLKNRGISNNYLNGTSYYIDNGSLTAFKYYYKESIYEEEEYFEDETYQFLIKK